jgi:anti-sigma factor RsiW
MDMDGHELLGAYALDAVDDADRSLFERHLATCDACWDELPSLMGAARRVAAVRPRAA